MESWKERIRKMGIGLEGEEKDGNFEGKKQTIDGRNKVEEGDRHKTEMGRRRQWGTNWGGGDRWRREADRGREANGTRR